MFPLVFVNSITLVFKEDGSSFATHCIAFCLDSSFQSRLCSSDLSLLSPCVNKKLFFFSDSRGGVGYLDRCSLDVIPDFETFFAGTLGSNLERKSAAVLTDPAMCATLKLKCST